MSQLFGGITLSTACWNFIHDQRLRVLSGRASFYLGVRGEPQIKIYMLKLVPIIFMVVGCTNDFRLRAASPATLTGLVLPHDQCPYNK